MNKTFSKDMKEGQTGKSVGLDKKTRNREYIHLPQIMNLYIQ